MTALDPSLLRPIPHFQGLEDADLRHILSSARPVRVESGQDVFREGDAADRVFLLLDGHIRVVRSSEDGEEIIVLHLHPGAMFGIAPAVGRKFYPATARAAGEVHAIYWRSPVWAGFVARYPGFAESTYGTVGKRLSEMNDRIMELATKQVEERVACALLRIVSQSGEKTDEGIRIDFPLTRQNMADMTGSTLHTVSRLLSAWDKDGIIRSARREIVVTDPEALERLAGKPDMI